MTAFDTSLVRTPQPESGLDWRQLWAEVHPGGDDADDLAYWNARSASFGASRQRSPYASEYLALAGIRPGESVIDMGCGSGTLALPLAAAGHHVVACDIARGMLDHLEDEARAAGLLDRLDMRQLSWRDAWEDLPVADVFVASRSLRAPDLAQTVLKMERHARRRVCLTVSAGEPPAHDAHMLAAIGRPDCNRSEYVYVANMLMQMGRLPELAYIEHDRPPVGATADEVRAEFEREDGPFSAEESELLDAFIARNFVFSQADDGTPVVERRYRRAVRWAFIAWSVPAGE